MVLTKALDHLMSWPARCTSGECALRFIALAPFLRDRSCEYIVRKSTLRVRERRRCGARCAGSRGAGGAWRAGSWVQQEKKSARCAQEEGSVHLSIETVSAEEKDKCAQQSA